MSKNDYTPGSTWRDRQGDTWIVLPNGRLECSLISETMTVADVESEYGPLTLIRRPRRFPDLSQYLQPPVTPIIPKHAWDACVERKLSISPELAEKVKDTNGDGFLDATLKTYEDALLLLVKKAADYGPRNISDSPGGPMNGLLVRMWDKMARLKNLIQSGADPENESLRDTFVDLLNYSAIALLVMDKAWPGVKESN